MWGSKTGGPSYKGHSINRGSGEKNTVLTFVAVEHFRRWDDFRGDEKGMNSGRGVLGKMRKPQGEKPDCESRTPALEPFEVRSLERKQERGRGIIRQNGERTLTKWEVMCHDVVICVGTHSEVLKTTSPTTSPENTAENLPVNGARASKGD
jgi:hypothetical protein